MYNKIQIFLYQVLWIGHSSQNSDFSNYLLTELVMNKEIQLERMKIQANILKIFYQYFKKGGKCLHEFKNYDKDGRIMSMVKLH